MTGVSVRVGDQVRVFDVNGRKRGQPEDGWPGVVEHVGRTLVTIAFNRDRAVFRMDTRLANDNYGHQRYMTLAEVAEQARLRVAVEALRYHGVELTPRHRLSVAEVEALVDALPSDGGEAAS